MFDKFKKKIKQYCVIAKNSELFERHERTTSKEKANGDKCKKKHKLTGCERGNDTL